MNSFLLLSLAAATPECDELKRNMKALEIYLQDQEDHKEYCPKSNWFSDKLKDICSISSGIFFF